MFRSWSKKKTDVYALIWSMQIILDVSFRRLNSVCSQGKHTFRIEAVRRCFGSAISSAVGSKHLRCNVYALEQ